jgi:hypothetical protein
VRILQAKLLDKAEGVETVEGWRFLMVWTELQPLGGSRGLRAPEVTVTDDASEKYQAAGFGCEVPMDASPYFLILSDLSRKGPNPYGQKNRGWWSPIFVSAGDKKGPMKQAGYICAWEGHYKKMILTVTKDEKTSEARINFDDYALKKKTIRLVWLFLVMSKATSFELNIAGVKQAVPLSTAATSGTTKP